MLDVEILYQNEESRFFNASMQQYFHLLRDHTQFERFVAVFNAGKD